MMAAAVRCLPETPRSTGRFDLPGALASTVGVGGLAFGIEHSATAGWADPVTLGAVVVGVFTLVALVINEGRVGEPIMPLHRFSSRERTGAYPARLLFAGIILCRFSPDLSFSRLLVIDVAFSPVVVIWARPHSWHGRGRWRWRFATLTSAVTWLGTTPKVAVPRQIFETRMPVRPRTECPMTVPFCWSVRQVRGHG